MTSAAKAAAQDNTHLVSAWGFRNRLLNSRFAIAQEGTTFSAANGTVYTADQWIKASVGTTLSYSTQAFTLGQTNLRAFMRLGVIGHYLGLMFRGWLPRRPAPDADVWQLGGDFILDRAGRLRYAHPCKDAADRPSRDELLEAMNQAQR